MKCKNHPDRDAIGVCAKHHTGYCLACCECLSADDCSDCLDPKAFCRYRTACIVWETAQERQSKR